LEKVIDDFKARYANVIKRYKLEKNEGMGIAMNYGLARASFEWIARMDSDDIAVPDRFEQQLKFLESDPAIDVLGSSIEEFDVRPGDLRRFRALPQENADIVKLMKYRNPINHMTVFYRKEVALRAGGYWSHRYNEDYNLWYEMRRNGAKFHNLSENLVHVRVGNNMVGRRTGYAYFEFEKILLKKFLTDRFITRIEYVCLILLKFSLRILPTKMLEMFYKFFLRKSVSICI
jgi:glycosyltransferase involved in cell wall biosynthesis